MARDETSAGFFNPEDSTAKETRAQLEAYIENSPTLDELTAAYDNLQSNGNYTEKKMSPLQRMRNRKSWNKIIQTSSNYDDPEFDTGEIDMIQNISDKINSGELYATEDIVEKLGERALALVPLADVELPAAQVENALLRVVAVNPDFEKEADEAIAKIYSNRPGMTPVIKKIISDTVHNTAKVAASPDDYIDTNSVDETVPAVNRILEQASHMTTSRRITQAVQEKQWAEEDEEADRKIAV